MTDVYSEALKIILRKRRTQKEVVDRLVKTGFELSEAEEAANYYRENGYIDHADYAKRFSRDAAKVKGYGAERIKMALKQKGIEENFIEEALEEIEFNIIDKMIKKCGEGGSITYKTAQKIRNHFITKGYSFDEINEAIKTLYTIERTNDYE